MLFLWWFSLANVTLIIGVIIFGFFNLLLSIYKEIAIIQSQDKPLVIKICFNHNPKVFMYFLTLFTKHLL